MIRNSLRLGSRIGLSKRLYFTVISIALAFSLSQDALGKGFPVGPDLRITPGALCDNPDEHRYPERIAYCRRDVSSGLKRQIIKVYDQKLGYSISEMNRQDFKIDHFIPLCAGGGNEAANLWPQHKTVYQQTDPMEPLICEKMQMGRLKQADAIRLVREAKLDLSKVEATIQYLEGL